MPILELTQLRLKGPSATDPALLQDLSTVREKLQTKSQFYSCIEDPTLIYILGSWLSLEQHRRFLASPSRNEVLGPQESVLQFCWTVHMELDSMSSLPLDAPVLAIERLLVEENSIDMFDQAALRHARHLQGSHPFKVVHGWRCDTPTGRHEALIFSGWKNADAHVTFKEKDEGRSDGDSAAVSVQHEQMLVHHAWNLERKGS
jgi:heme-degrading monooxygenase HmoA